jgi:hypothetical protein
MKEHQDDKALQGISDVLAEFRAKTNQPKNPFVERWKKMGYKLVLVLDSITKTAYVKVAPGSKTKEGKLVNFREKT